MRTWPNPIFPTPDNHDLDESLVWDTLCCKVAWRDCENVIKCGPLVDGWVASLRGGGERRVTASNATPTEEDGRYTRP